ncbi:hypothetical protein TTHERM_000530109 (macronuclear) [Tetrahymena thermophila SB210]|uniref:Uncharacterized protein n=1 Tax=Tetrahymena thermophila (strain SB210) TaxID=312017 RepID=W7X7R2_TETTS|nr:hypothetical protein TTHERM_000530109 [Tetrahymena thermophila SB210]EWS72463.1 hypothetical protein TTHERM_000530109 [Tetrahymena thermophila SB210]|eukprot:XP_012655008.1 hypothetical protein TTHERM_000530109 [Tetrahymena thermophila SB210]
MIKRIFQAQHNSKQNRVAHRILYLKIKNKVRLYFQIVLLYLQIQKVSTKKNLSKLSLQMSNAVVKFKLQEEINLYKVVLTCKIRQINQMLFKVNTFLIQRCKRLQKQIKFQMYQKKFNLDSTVKGRRWFKTKSQMILIFFSSTKIFYF